MTYSIQTIVLLFNTNYLDYFTIHKGILLNMKLTNVYATLNNILCCLLDHSKFKNV